MAHVIQSRDPSQHGGKSNHCIDLYRLIRELLVKWEDLGDLGGGGGADGLWGDGLGTQQHPWVPLCQAVHRLWERHLLSVTQEPQINFYLKH